MSHNLDSPVQTQMAVAVLNPILSGEGYLSIRSEGKPVGRRRIFVQTETGCVLGMELDRSDNVHTVKKRLQVALNVPTEESSLTFGDLVLENDLSSIRKDSPLLLSRSPLHRSSSTPCLSLAGQDAAPQRDGSGPIEILGCSSCCFEMKQIVKEVMKGMKNGVDPVRIPGGLGGAYYFRNRQGVNVAIVKPTDEEPFAPNNPKGFVGKAIGHPGVKRTVRVGEAGFREVAAYLLDYDHFANVPPTVIVKITHSIFHVNEGVNCNNTKKQGVVSKIASLQQFIPHDFDASDHGTSGFPVAAVHRIGILDIRIFNTDRHAGNLLVRRVVGETGRFGGQVELIPIDHGLCLPESLEDPFFEWIHWPQASIPFLEDELEYIARLDPERDADMLRRELPMIHEACLRVLVLCTIFLKEAAGFGLCLSEIGEIMTRPCRWGYEVPSELEVVCMEAKKSAVVRHVCPSECDSADEDGGGGDGDGDGVFQMDMYDTDKADFGFEREVSTNLLSRLEESNDEEEEDEGKEQVTSFHHVREQFMNDSMISASLDDVWLTGKPRLYQVGALSRDDTTEGLTQGGSRKSADELLSASFVSVADLSEDEWLVFLKRFQELLPSAFLGRRFKATELKQWKRFGTSCKF